MPAVVPSWSAAYSGAPTSCASTLRQSFGIAKALEARQRRQAKLLQLRWPNDADKASRTCAIADRFYGLAPSRRAAILPSHAALGLRPSLLQKR